MPSLPVLEKRSGTALFLMTIAGRALPRVVGMQREKSWLFFDVVLPFCSMSGFVLVYRAFGAPEDYVGFVVFGGAMMAFWLNVLWSMSSQLYWEKEQGNLGLYIMAPCPMPAILLGMAVGGLFATVIRAAVIVAAGSLLFGVTYAVSDGFLLALAFFLCMTALYGLGMASSSIYLLLGREAWHVTNMIEQPVYLVSGFYFPVKDLGFWAAGAASIIPLTLGLDAMRQLAFASGPSLGFLGVGLELGILAFLAVAFLLLSDVMIRTIERLAVREGRITESRG
jgi:ABC-2 type transport system permease protein